MTFPLPADDSPMLVYSSEVFIEFVLYYLCSSSHFVFLMCTFFLMGTTWLFKMTSNRRIFMNHPDNFPYICGQYTPKQQCRNITKSIQFAYKYYFDCNLGDQDKEWAPHVCCAPCNVMLPAWMNGKRKALPFSIPIVWHEPKNHFNDCYFCMTNIVRKEKQIKDHIPKLRICKKTSTSWWYKSTTSSTSDVWHQFLWRFY